MLITLSHQSPMHSQTATLGCRWVGGALFAQKACSHTLPGNVSLDTHWDEAVGMTFLQGLNYSTFQAEISGYRFRPN